MRTVLLASLGLLWSVLAHADEPKPPKIYDVPKEGLVIEGKISQDDPPLADVRGRPPHQFFRVRLKQGQRYVFYLASSDFDALLLLQNAAGKTLAGDHNSGGGQNARMMRVISTDGEYRLVALATDRKPGKFQLKVRPGDLTAEELADRVISLGREGIQLYQRGQAVLALPMMREMLEICRRLYPTAQYPGGHPDLATSLNNVGAALDALGRPEEALPYMRQGLEMRQKLLPTDRYPDGHQDLAASLYNLGNVLKALGRPEQALPYMRQCLEMRQKLYPASKYPDGHPDLADGFDNLGTVLQALVQPEQALPYYRQSLEMRQKLIPKHRYLDGHPKLALSLSNLGNVLQELGQSEQALHYMRQALQMRQKLFPGDKYPAGHPDLACSLSNLGAVLQALGQPEQALSYMRQALEMFQKLYPAGKYPDGHPHLATSLHNLASVLHSAGQLDQALRYVHQSLEMFQKLFPKAKHPAGHPELAQCLTSLGSIQRTQGQYAHALLCYRLGLQMNQELFPPSKYPDGHPELAKSHHNLGAVLYSLGRWEQALPDCRQCVEMWQRIFPKDKYPDGHPHLAASLGNLGHVLNAQGQSEQALLYFRQGLQMQQRLLRRELITASEEAALDKIEAEPPHRDGFLSITRTTRTPTDEVVAQLWPSRAIVTRLLEQRQASARAAGTELGAQLDELRGLRRRFDQLLQDTRMKPEDRDKLLTDVANKRDKLERELVAKMPTLKRWQELDKLGPADLVKALQPGAVFVDVIRYTHFEYVDKKQKRSLRYVAFVMAKDRPIQRVELDLAEPIDSAVKEYRTAIESRGDESKAAGELQRLVWTKLAAAIPSGTTTLYLAADGVLARVPWAALPIGKDRILLEDFAVAQVPHGLWLLDHLRTPRTFTGPESLFALGSVDYGGEVWPKLPGTKIELDAIAALADGERATASGKDASVARVKELLPKARYAHLATHGEFKADALTEERKRAARAFEAQLRGDDSRKVAAKNPLGYVGVVLSNGEILSGLGIVDLKLDNLKLVTLSACETGLGEYTGGEGVQGLQHAFHLAGCPNVVASLWKVNDAATAALMAKFYHEMWVNKKPPIEALREAQLTIYRRPDLIPDLAGGRGAPNLKKAVTVRAGAPATGKGKHADTKLWAAFVLSGVGR